MVQTDTWVKLAQVTDVRGTDNLFSAEYDYSTSTNQHFCQPAQIRICSSITSAISRIQLFPFTLPKSKCSYLGQFTSDFKKSKTYFSLRERGFRNDKDLLSICFGFENPLLLVGHLRCFRKRYFSSVTSTTHKETSAVSDPGMLGQV